MTKFRDFGAASGGTYEDIKFKLYDEEFLCLPEVQGSVLLELVGSSDNETRSAAMITEFFQNVLTDESWERFDALIHSKDRFVKIETLGEITGWIVETYSDRPETPPEQ